MIPKINNRGHSFKGVTAYLMHDKEANTAERVAWTRTGNMHTDDIEKAAIIMAWTDRNAELLKQSAGGSLAGAKPSAGGVYHCSLSWSPDDTPDREHMEVQGAEILKRLQLENHQYYFVAHSDTDHAHMHIVVNLTNPENGQRVTPSFDKRELQKWALEYEQEHGIYCELRATNAAKRARGENVKHQDTKQDYSERVTRAFYAADSGKAFANSLEAEGLHLAQGRRGGFVIVDEKGDIQKLGRQLEIEERGKEKTALIKTMLGDIQANNLQDAEVLSAKLKVANKEREQQQPEKAESKEHDQKESTTSQKFNQEANREEEASAKETFNQKAAGEFEAEEPSKPNARNSFQGKSTAELAENFLEMARNPLYDLRGWLDETGGEQRQDNDSVLAGQAGSEAEDNALRPLRGAGEDGNAQDRTSGEPSAKQTDSGQGYKENEEQEQLEELKEQLKIPRYVRLKKIRAENAALREAQSEEKAALVVRLRKEESQKEKDHRARLTSIIEEQKAEQAEVKTQLEKKGLVGFYTRFRYGKDLREKITAYDKNIANAQMRLDEGIGNLSSYDKIRIAILGETHRKQRKDLREEQREDLQAIEAVRAEQEQELLQQAQSSPERAGELKSAVKTKSQAGKEQAAHIEAIEREYSTSTKDKPARPALSPAEKIAAEYEQPDNMQHMGQWFNNASEGTEKQRGVNWFSHDEDQQQEMMAEYREELQELGYDEDQQQEMMAEMERERERQRLQGLDQGHEL